MYVYNVHFVYMYIHIWTHNTCICTDTIIGIAVHVALMLLSQTFEGNHCLIDAVLRMGSVVRQELLLHCSDDWLDLLETMKPGLIPQRQGGVVREVEVT